MKRSILSLAGFAAVFYLTALQAAENPNQLTFFNNFNALINSVVQPENTTAPVQITYILKKAIIPSVCLGGYFFSNSKEIKAAALLSLGLYGLYQGKIEAPNLGLIAGQDIVRTSRWALGRNNPVTEEERIQWGDDAHPVTLGTDQHNLLIANARQHIGRVATTNRTYKASLGLAALLGIVGVYNWLTA